MSLCWGENVNDMGSGRKKKEYDYAAFLSSKLLVNQSHGLVSVIYTIIYKDDN